jgi:hypothetical protein
VRTYTLHASRTTVVKAPLTKRLKAGTEYEFEIRSTDYVKLLLRNNQKSTPLLKEGDMHRVSILPEKGTLLLAGFEENQDKGRGLFSYEVE